MKSSSISTLRLERVSVVYGSGVVALRDIDLRVEAGEVVGFVGPSGAGKTSLFRLFNGTVRPSIGKVVVNGEDLTTLTQRKLRAMRCRIGTVHQDLSLIPTLRVIHNVLAGKLGQRSLLASFRHMLLLPRAEVRRVYEILEWVGISDKLYERTSRLSGGQRQRVAVARALYQEPSVLLADEPVSSVDPARARDTIKLLIDISQRTNLTLCISLHNLELARLLLPRLVGLRQGHIAFDKATCQLDESDFHGLYDL
jgi:phosphonate transport system ATP-binding protein